jgi:DNA modification methylase
MSVRIEHGDMREVLARLIADGVTVQSIVSDPPYHLTALTPGTFGHKKNGDGTDRTQQANYKRRGFMNQAWDGGDIAFQPDTWRLCYDLLPPGGHLLAFSGTRTYHRMVCAIEDAGFEIRDTIAWLYGSGFPKSHNVSKGIDKAAGAEREVIGDSPFAARKPNGSAGVNSVGLSGTSGSIITAPATDAARQWEGWGTALKPALEPICLARKPLDGTVAGNVQKHGTGALNIDGCRVAAPEGGVVRMAHSETGAARGYDGGIKGGNRIEPQMAGRWPANVCHDGSDEVVKAFPDSDHARGNNGASKGGGGMYGHGQTTNSFGAGDTGNASRFFYSSKADADDRLGSKHPTVKPVDLMRWLVRLITPPGGTVLDPFAGSGTTGMACMAEGFDCILVEREAEYVADIKRRLAHVRGYDTPLFKPQEALL